MQKILLFITFFSSVGLLFSQFQLKGYAPDFLGQEVKLYTYQDYVTLNRVQLGEGRVNSEDSTFTIDLNTNSTIEVIVEIGRTEAKLYVAPEANYEIYFPKSEDPISYQNAQTNIYFGKLDSTDINYRILQYHQWLDAYISYNDSAIARGGFLTYLDTFKTYVADAYGEIEDPFFITYVRYDIAELEQSAGANRKSEGRLNTFLTYIEPFPLYYENDRYMEFVLGFYNKEFRDYSPKTEDAILKAINNSSPTELMLALRNDIFLANPELRELIMVDKLGKAYYRETNFRDNITVILDSVSNHAQSQFNANVAKNVKAYITSLEQGYPAPAISIAKTPEETITWSNYLGKFVYFNFFATWSEASVNEMELISKLIPRYGEDIAFLSVCVDKDSTTYEGFIKEHPEYTWDILYIGEDKSLMASYKATSVPSYYLIDQEAFIFAAPALAPSPNGEYESIGKVMFEIQEALHPKQPIRVGE